jgi:hypothetical protein
VPVPDTLVVLPAIRDICEAERMSCPSCGQRKGRRDCPALGQSICTVCCGTKRLTEINCPSDCGYLTSSRAHPAAAVKKQQEIDVALILPSIRQLTERQHQLFFLFHSLIARHTPEGFSRLIDADVAEAAATAAATLETAARGVIYEHSAQSVPAQRLATEIRTMLQEMRQGGATVFDREAAIVLRAIEQGARETGKEVAKIASVGGVPLGTGDPHSVYLELMGRLLRVNKAARQAADAKPSSSLILP